MKNKTDIQDSFDGIGTIITEGEAVGDISSAEGNVYATGELTRANMSARVTGDVAPHAAYLQAQEEHQDVHSAMTWATCTMTGAKVKVRDRHRTQRRTLPTRNTCSLQQPL